MNKHKKALLVLYNYAREMREVISTETEYINYALDLLMPLTEKETPMKTNWAEQGRRRCSRCDHLWHMSGYRFFYCPSCGQKIDWGDQHE